MLDHQADKPSPQTVPTGKAHQQKLRDYQESHATSSELAFDSYGLPSKRRSFASEVVFEEVFTRLVASEALSQSDATQLRLCHPLMDHLLKLMDKTDSNLACELFDCDKDCNNQQEVPLARRMQFLFLGSIRKFHVPCAVRSLKGNCAGDHRDAPSILKKVKCAISHDSCLELERVLVQGCPTRFQGETTREQFFINCCCGDHNSVNDDLDKVNETVIKEDKRERVAVFPSSTARFVPSLRLTPMGLVIEPGKNDRLIFDASFQADERAAPVNSFARKTNEPESQHGDAWSRHLTRICSLRLSCPNRDAILYDDDASGAFRHSKSHPGAISALAFIIGKQLFFPIGQTFGANASPSNEEVIALVRQQSSESASLTSKV